MDMSEQNFTDTETKATIEEMLETIGHLQAVRWAADCAEHTLPLYEEKYPNDDRPRNAIDAARNWLKGDIGVRDARKSAFATHAAARETQDESAIAAARAAGQAVSTAHLAGHAIHASTYAAKAAAIASGFDEAAVEAERQWQLERLNDIKRNYPNE